MACVTTSAAIFPSGKLGELRPGFVQTSENSSYPQYDRGDNHLSDGSDEEDQVAVESAHQRHSGMTTLVTSITRQQSLKNDAEVLFFVSSKPRSLLKTVEELIQRQEQNSRQAAV